MPKREKKAIWLCSLVFIGVAGIMLYLGNEGRAQTASAPPMLRLHVIADSDSEYDQELKLEVRDAIIGMLREDLHSASSAAEAESLLADSLEQIRLKADGVLSGRADYRSRVELGSYKFPTKGYGELNLPAGEYRALRIVLGSGEGKNWWCVLFPSLCYVDAVGEVNDIMAVSTGREGIKIRWKIAELLSAFRRYKSK